MVTRVRLVGLPRFLSTLGAARRDLADQSETMLEASEILARGISATAPRRTGRLAASPRPDGDRDGGEVILPLEYSVYPNYGAPKLHQLPQYFVERAIRAVEAPVVRRISNGLQRALDRVRGA